jgi:hypothetical protein
VLTADSTQALGLKWASGGAVSTATTVNGHALSSNVTVSASDLTTGTLPHAQLPTLLSGDIPNNAANTTGTASNAIDVNGASIPTSAKALASNASNQIIAATLSGSGAALTTGPTSSTSGDLVSFTGSAGQIADSGVAAANVPLLNAANAFTNAGSNTFSGSVKVTGTVTTNTAASTALWYSSSAPPAGGVIGSVLGSWGPDSSNLGAINLYIAKSDGTGGTTVMTINKQGYVGILSPSTTWLFSMAGSKWGVDSNGITHEASTAPTSSAGSVATYSTNAGGEITGLSSATNVTITFANSGWTSAAFCVANASTTLATNVYNSAQSKTAVTFTFPALTGGLFYHCDGN